jgi:hypothetical protein
MKQRWSTLGALAALTFTGCSETLSVRGMVASTGDRFTGTATGYMDGSGDLKIAFVGGRTCSGEFVYVNGRQGEGTFECSDGATGPFSFVSTGQHGTGTGSLRGQLFTFTFG